MHRFRNRQKNSWWKWYRFNEKKAAAALQKKSNHAKDLNIDKQITNFINILKSEHIYRILLRYVSDIGKINFPTKMDYRIKHFLETNMNKLFEYKKLQAAGTAIPAADAQIIFTRAPFIQYEQILLDKNFRQYLDTIIVSKKILKNGSSKNTPAKTIQKKDQSGLFRSRIFRCK